MLMHKEPVVPVEAEQLAFLFRINSQVLLNKYALGIVIISRRA